MTITPLSVSAVASSRGTVWSSEYGDLLRPYYADWRARCARYDLHRAYYDGSVYRDRADVRKALKLYAGVRQVFGPLRRAVRVDVAKVPGDWRHDAAVSPRAREIAEIIRRTSDYRREYARAVFYGAVCGEIGLYVSDDPTPRVHAVAPDNVVVGESADGARFGVVLMPNVLTARGRVERAVVATPEQVTTLENGEVVETRGNPSGVVPIVLSPYLTTFGERGEGAFSGAQELLDRVNDLASQALDVVQAQADPLLAVSGVDSVEVRKGDNVLVLPPADAKAYPINPQLVIDQATELLDRMLNEFKHALPQLHLDMLYSRNQLAFETVQLLMSELIDYIVAVRRNVDAAIADAERAAMRIGAARGLWDVTDDDLAGYALDAERPVFTLMERSDE